MATITPQHPVSGRRDYSAALSVLGSGLVIVLAGVAFALLLNKVVGAISAVVSGI